MTTIRSILDKKGHQVYAIHPTATVYQALELMADKDVGAVLVMDGDQPIGILSERDYARKIVLTDRVSRNTPVLDIMTPDPVCVALKTDIDEAMRLMTERRIRHLPVMDHDVLMGMISIGDVVRAMLEEQEFRIEQLESYIMS